eukprot:CAMPEP_0116126824 /NCGR_PEP_ID=MMETSP0329-20121206/6528_1 /TAXON_ID=697910 /ORGANISM="Pseudo-nitzschia arenysensis, Strain B593" /LENGTH=462 /DNA_ID=CAMNT_0003620913 /DNA_START=1101 /DNA_END=2489 /DNA_ORIENTATION=+
MKSIHLVGASSTLVLHLASAFQSSHVSRTASSALCSTAVGIGPSGTIDVTEGAQRDLEWLDDWATNCGTQKSDGFEIRQLMGNYWDDDARAITNQDLPIDSPILYVPEGVILTGQKAKQELGRDASEAEQMLAGFYGPNEISKFYLFLKLMAEHEAGESSPYFSYLNSLPRFFSNGASMTNFCYGCLPPYAAGIALGERTKKERYLQALEKVTLGFFLSRESVANDALAQWAFAVVHTRSTQLPNGDFGIVPLADYFNHGGTYEANAYLSFDEEGNCYAYSNQDVPAGSPLLISYGDSTNPSKLLAQYGFLDETSQATYCKYIIDNPTDEMKAMGYPERMLFYTSGEISPEVWDVVLYEQLGKARSMQQQQELYQAVASGDEATKQRLHQDYFTLTFQAIQAHVNFLVNELDELDIGIETQMGSGANAYKHLRLPLLQKHNAYIRTILLSVEENLSNMGGGQ